MDLVDKYYLFPGMMFLGTSLASEYRNGSRTWVDLALLPICENLWVNIENHFSLPAELSTKGEEDSDIETDYEEEGDDENNNDHNKKIDFTE